MKFRDVNLESQGLRHIVGLSCLLAIAFAVRLLGLDRGIWIDESTSIHFSLGEWNRLVKSNFHFPAYFALLKGWSIFGHSEPTLRLLSVIFGMGALVFSLLLSLHFSNTAAYATGALWIALPTLVLYSQEIRHYGLLLLLTTIALYFCERFARQKDTRLSSLTPIGIAMALAVATHAIGIFLILPLGLYLAISAPDKVRILLRSLRAAIGRYRYRFALIALAAFVVTGLYLGLRSKPILFSRGTWTGIPDVAWTKLPALFYGLSGGPYVDDLFSRILPSVSILHWTGSIFVALIALSLLFGNLRPGLPFLIASLVYWTQVVAVAKLYIPIAAERTLLPGLAPFIIFIGVQISTIRIPNLRRLSMGIVLIYSLLLVARWMAIDSNQPREPWKPIAQVMEAGMGPDDLAVFHPFGTCVPILYYFDVPKKNRFLFNEKRGWGTKDLEESLAQRPKTARIFFVTREDANLDRDRDRRLRELIQRQFPREERPFLNYLTIYSH